MTVESEVSSIRGLLLSLQCDRPPREKYHEISSLRNSSSFFERKLCELIKLDEQILIFLSSVREASLQSSSIKIGDESLKNGAYMMAFTSGIIETRKVFQERLIRAEERIVFTPHPNYGSHLQLLVQMDEAYTHLASLINYVVERKLSGCLLLDYCHHRSHDSPSLKPVMDRLLVRLEQVLVGQVKCWALGVPTDPWQEFFIVERSSPPPPTNCSIITSMLASTSTNLPFSTDFKSEKIYEIDPSKVPVCLPYSLVSKIYSVGKFVALLKQAPSEADGERVPTTSSYYEETRRDVRAKFVELESCEVFHSSLLDAVIDQVHIVLSKYFKKLAEDIGDFSGQYQMITDVFLMGRGELFMEFIKVASPLLLAEVSTVRSRSLTLTLEHVAADLYLGKNLKFLEYFNFELPPRGSVPPGTQTLSVLKLNYKAPWPLHIMFTTEILRDYDTIFGSLLNMKFVHMTLLNVWHDIRSLEKKLSLGVSRFYHELLTIITGLQEYVYVDVILSEKSKLEQVVHSSDSFHEIEKAHICFLSNLMNQLFLYPNQSSLVKGMSEMTLSSMEYWEKKSLIQEELKQLYSVINTFCGLFSCDDEDSKLVNLFVQLCSDFKQIVQRIMTLVNNINEKYQAEYLTRLILRLDYNNYFSNLVSKR